MEKNNRNISRREALKRIGRLAAVATVAGSMPTALLADERLIAYSSFSNRVAHQAATQVKPNTQAATPKSGAASTSTQSSSSQTRRGNTGNQVPDRQYNSSGNSSSGSIKSAGGRQSRYPSYISYNSYR